jgi:hypothetical protein
MLTSGGERVILEEVVTDRHRSEQRRHLRFPAALPVILHCDGKRYAATVVNISAAGALVRLSVRPEVGSAFVVRCGSTTVTAEVVWIGTGHAGVSFARPLQDAELVEHINRSRAIAARRVNRELRSRSSSLH